MTDNKERIDYLDIAKGISIISIVIGHGYSYWVGNGEYLIPYIYSFHVPIFFIISGIIYRKKGTGNLDYKKKAKELLIPFFIWGSIYRLFLMVLATIGGNMEFKISSYLTAFFQYSSGAMWFLPTMFVAMCLFQSVSAIKSYRVQIVFCIAALMLGSFIPHSFGMFETLLRGLIGSTFIMIGYYGANLFSKTVKPWLWFTLLIVDIIVIHFYGTADLARRNLGFLPLYLLVSCLGSWLCISCSKIIELWEFPGQTLKNIGKLSIITLCTHQIVITVLQLLDYKLLDYNIQKTGEFEGVIIGVITMIIIYGLLPLLAETVGWTFGIFRNKRYISNI